MRRILSLMAAALVGCNAFAAPVFAPGTAQSHEAAIVDRRSGAFVNHDLAEYLVPVHADIPEIDAIVLDGFDGKANVLGLVAVERHCLVFHQRVPHHQPIDAPSVASSLSRPRHRIASVANTGKRLRRGPCPGSSAASCWPRQEWSAGFSSAR